MKLLPSWLCRHRWHYQGQMRACHRCGQLDRRNADRQWVKLL